MDVIRVRRWDRWQRRYISIGPRLLEYLRARLPIPDKPLGRRALEIHAGRAGARCAHERVELRALLSKRRGQVPSSSKDPDPGVPVTETGIARFLDQQTLCLTDHLFDGLPG